MFCTNCGTKLEDGSIFCTNCGSKLIDSNIAEVSSNGVAETNKVVDASTGVEVNGVIDASSVVDSSAVADASAMNTSEVAEPQVAENKDLEAEIQDTYNLTQEQQVPNGQAEVSAEQPELGQQWENAEAGEPVAFCTSCGTQLDKDSEFCTNCGAKVAVTAPDEQPMQQVTAPDEQPMQQVTAPDEQPLQQVTAPDEQPMQQVTAGPAQAETPVSNQGLPTPVQGSNQVQDVDSTSVKTKKSKKGLFAAIIILAVLVLGAGGFIIFSKITLGKLGDSVETFKALVAEKGLDNIEEYSNLIEEAEEKASGWLLFGAADMEKRLEEATAECILLSEDLVKIKVKISDFENLDKTLIMDSNQIATINEYVSSLNDAISAGDKDEAENILAELESYKNILVSDSRSYVESLLADLKNYYNHDFSAEDWNLLENEFAMVENYINANEFVKAKDQISTSNTKIAEIEERIIMEKEAEAFATLNAKPQTLTVMISDVMYNEESYRNEFEAALEAELGIDIVFHQITDGYSDGVKTSIASGYMPDVFYLSRDMYKEYQDKGLLVDITQYWNESELLSSSNFYGKEAMERLQIDGKLYGFSPVRGYTNVIYIRKSWLEQAGLSVPKTYDEFYQMLAAFSDNNMDGKDTYGMTAPGFISVEEPYTSFLQPFYQKAIADIYQNSSGEWIDGFEQQDMLDALYRLQDAYSKGYLDPGMADRTTKDAITEFGSGKCGVISLWEGVGADFLTNELKKNGIEDDIIVMEPLAEMGGYIGTEPGVFVITTNCKNPGGVVKYFFEPMLDGGTVQKLWTYGVEGYHWAAADATKPQDLESQEVTTEQESTTSTEEGLPNQLATLQYQSMVANTYNYNFIDPLRALAAFKDGDPGLTMISDIAELSSKIANQYYMPYQNVIFNDTYWRSFGDIQSKRIATIYSVIKDSVDPLIAMEDYKTYTQSIMNQVLTELNQY